MAMEFFNMSKIVVICGPDLTNVCNIHRILNTDCNSFVVYSGNGKRVARRLTYDAYGEAEAQKLDSSRDGSIISII